MSEDGRPTNTLPPVPKSWCWTTVGELAAPEPNSITDGPFGSKLKTSHYASTGARVIRLQNIGDGDFKDERAFISEEHFRSLEKHHIFGGDIAIAALGETLPRSCIIPDWVGPALVKADCPRFQPDSKLANSAFVNFALNSPDVRNRTSATIHGVGRPRLNLSELRAIALPLAPLNEQVRIGDKLDELLSDLDAGVKALTGVQAKLKQYRAAVLKAAVEGTLTADKPFSQYPIADAIESLGQGWSPKCLAHPSPNDETWGVIKTTAIQPMQYLEEHNKELPSNLAPRQRLELRQGDLLITRAGPRSRAGIACMVKKTRPRLILCDKAYRVRLKPNTLSAAFLEVALNAPNVAAKLDELKTGINDSGVNLTQDRFGELLVPFPSEDEQSAIVEAVETQLSVIDHLETDLDAKLTSAAALRQSILKCAFEGQLVPQDPSDEPASELLKRIAAERAERERLARAAKKAAKPKKAALRGRMQKTQKEA